MHIATKTLPKSSVELTIELSSDELAPYLERAAASLSREHPLPGFRPGKVPVTVAAQRYGAMALHTEAADQAVRDAVVRAVREQTLATIGSPRIAITTLAPDNPVRFTATVTVLPAVTLPDLATITVARRPVAVAPEAIDRALEGLRKLQRTETIVDRPAISTDTVVVDLDLTRGGVPMEGGRARDHRIALTEPYDLPEVSGALIGMRKGEEKTFPLTFPHDHRDTSLAGITVDGTVRVKDVYAVELPPLNDAFAQRLGQQDAAALRNLVTENLMAEAERKARDAEEIAMLDAIVARARIDDLPDLLVTGEARRMVDELERGVVRQGLAFDAELTKAKTTREALLLDVAPDAVRRVEVALVTHAVAEAQREACAVAATDIEAEIAQQLTRYHDTPEFHDRIRSEESRDYVRTTLRNRKVIAWLRTQVRWEEAPSRP